MLLQNWSLKNGIQYLRYMNMKLKQMEKAVLNMKVFQVVEKISRN